MWNTEILSKKIVPSEIQLEEDGFTFFDSTEHPMTKIETAFENKWALIAWHKKIFFEQVVRPQKRRFCIFQLNIGCRSPKTTFEKVLMFDWRCWKA